MRHTLIQRADGSTLDTDIEQLSNNKADKSEVYNKIETEQLINNITDEASTFVVPEGIDPNAGTYIAVGGLNKGYPANDKSVVELLQKMLYPYQEPSFTSFKTNLNSTLECGASTPSTIIFSWTTTNAFNFTENSITLKDLTTNTVIASDLNATDSPYTASNMVPISYNTPASHSFQILGVDNNEPQKTHTSNYTISWRWKYYYGADTHEGTPPSSADIAAGDYISESELKGLASGMGANNGTKIIIQIPVGTRRVVIAYPANLREITSIVSAQLGQDIKGGFVNGLMSAISGATPSATTSYRVYVYQALIPYETADTYTVTI